MSEIQKKIDEIETEMARTQKNKATNYHLGTLKAKIAKLRSELINGPGGKSAGTKNAERGFDVSKSGDTRIGLGKFCRYSFGLRNGLGALPLGRHAIRCRSSFSKF